MIAAFDIGGSRIKAARVAAGEMTRIGEADDLRLGGLRLQQEGREVGIVERVLDRAEHLAAVGFNALAVFISIRNAQGNRINGRGLRIFGHNEILVRETMSEWDAGPEQKAEVIIATTNEPAMMGDLISEVFVTGGLVWLVGRLASTGRGAHIPAAVGLWVLAASIFSSSGAQANPAVAIGLLLVGQGTAQAAGFILAQLLGMLIAAVFVVIFADKPKAEVAVAAPAAAVEAVAKKPAARKPAAKKPAAKKPAAK